LHCRRYNQATNFTFLRNKVTDTQQTGVIGEAADMSNIISTIVKGILTFFFWAGAIAVSVVAITNANGQDLGAVTVLPFVMALLATIAIWGIPELARINEARSGKISRRDDYEKGKREPGSRRIEQLAVLLELMDDQEQEEFKQALKQRVLDGSYGEDELLFSDESLESLLEEKRADRRLR
jgi:hypothetical protein